MFRVRFKLRLKFMFRVRFKFRVKFMVRVTVRTFLKQFEQHVKIV